MFTRPVDLSDAQLADVLHASWGLHVDALEYAAVGFGSHHWLATSADERWFVTVDDLEMKKRAQAEPVGAVAARLSAALDTAWALQQAGLEFVVAPTRTTRQAIVDVVDQRFAVAVYPFVEGITSSSGTYSTRAERLAVLDLLVELHAATALAQPTAGVDDLTIANRDQLEAALASLDEPWTIAGPFGEPARALVADHAAAIRRVVARRDGLARIAAREPQRMVLTHGEPHAGNTITTRNGPVLIDWDTAMIAPPERDVWSLADEDPSIDDDYTARTGVIPRSEILELYRLSWDISEIAIYVGEFRQHHEETQDTRAAWESLEHHLDPTRWQE